MGYDTTVIPQTVQVDNTTLQNSSGVISVKNSGITATQIADGTITTTKTDKTQMFGWEKVFDGNSTAGQTINITNAKRVLLVGDTNLNSGLYVNGYGSGYKTQLVQGTGVIISGTTTYLNTYDYGQCELWISGSRVHYQFQNIQSTTNVYFGFGWNSTSTSVITSIRTIGAVSGCKIYAQY